MLVSVLTMLVLLLFVLIFPRAKNNNGRVSQQSIPLSHQTVGAPHRPCCLQTSRPSICLNATSAKPFLLFAMTARYSVFGTQVCTRGTQLKLFGQPTIVHEPRLAGSGQWQTGGKRLDLHT